MIVSAGSKALRSKRGWLVPIPPMDETRERFHTYRVQFPETRAILTLTWV